MVSLIILPNSTIKSPRYIKKLAIVTLTAFNVQAQEKLIADLSLETTLLLDTLNA